MLPTFVQRSHWLLRLDKQDLILIALVAVAWLFANLVFEHSSCLWALQGTAALILIGVSALVFAVRRVRELRRATEVASRLARHDELTGLPNRRAFLERLHDWKARLQPMEECALILLDLDDFKPINDIYGHRLGDEVLRTMAERLRKIVGSRGFVARMGGDEFGILLPMVSDTKASLRVGRSIVDELPQPIQLAALSVGVGVSVGIAVVTSNDETSNDLTAQDGSVIETVMRQADMALYQAKAREGSNYRFFTPALDQQLRLRIELEREIGPAIDAGQIVPYYQPLVDLKSGDVVGCEALARWEHPTRGLLLPPAFIGMAKSTGNLASLTYSILRQAIKHSRTWPERLTLAVNLSPCLVTNSWRPQEILRILAEQSFPAHRLELEITERTLIDPTREAKVVLESLRNLGIKLALDDFGAGYSNLSYLRDFEFDRVKIDHSFVTELLSNPKHLLLVQIIISFCKTLRMQTTAEGIESFEVAERLAKLGCDVGQGFVFSKPKPNHELLRYFQARSSRDQKIA